MEGLRIVSSLICSSHSGRGRSKVPSRYHLQLLGRLPMPMAGRKNPGGITIGLSLPDLICSTLNAMSLEASTSLTGWQTIVSSLHQHQSERRFPSVCLYRHPCAPLHPPAPTCDLRNRHGRWTQQTRTLDLPLLGDRGRLCITRQSHCHCRFRASLLEHHEPGRTS